MTEYHDRQDFELDNWPELRAMVNDLANLVYSERTIDRELKKLLFTMASQSNGSLH